MSIRQPLAVPAPRETLLPRIATLTATVLDRRRPIVLDGRVWGLMVGGLPGGEPLPDRIEDRLAEVTELVAAAISTTATHDELRAQEA